MVQARDIEAWVTEIARLFKPQRIILFGSYAYGTPTDDSDVDLLVVMRYRGDSTEAAIRISSRTPVWFPRDILVRSPAEIRRRLQMEDFFMMDIIKQGLILHEKDDRRMGEQGRRRLRRRLKPASLAKARAR